MKFFQKASLSFLAVASLAVSTPHFAKAEGFALQDWSARGASLAGGVVARGGDAAAVAYNPAAITELEGTQVMLGGEIISLTNTIVGAGPFAGQESESKHKLYTAPHGYITHKASDTISLGLGMYSRYGLGNNHGAEFFGSEGVYNVELITFSVTPVLAWQVTDKLSLGFGVELMYGDVQLDKAMTLAPGLKADAGLTGDALAKGFNISAHYRFNDQWKAGFVFRSHTDLNFSGDLKVSGLPAGLPIQNGTYSGSATLYTPDSYTLALAYYPTQNLSFEGQVQYNTWSRYSELTIDTGIGTIPSVKNWKDTWLFSLSAEYDWNEWLTLRAGASYETSPVDEAHADFVAPVNGRWKYAAGFGVHKDSWSVDFSYVYHDINTLYYDRSEVALLASRTKDVHAHTFGLSLGYKF